MTPEITRSDIYARKSELLRQAHSLPESGDKTGILDRLRDIHISTMVFVTDPDNDEVIAEKGEILNAEKDLMRIKEQIALNPSSVPRSIEIAMKLMSFATTIEIKQLFLQPLEFGLID